MAYCSKCGAEIKGNFCSNCGNPINTLSVQHNSSNSEPNVHSVGDFTYTDDDLKFYEDKLNGEIHDAEIGLKNYKYFLYAAIAGLIFVIIHWNATTGFWNALITILIFFADLLCFLGAGIRKSYYTDKMNKLKQHNAYTYMIKHLQEEQKWKTVGQGLQAFNNGMKVYNAANNIGIFLGRL